MKEKNNIELELRSEISKRQAGNLIKKLRKDYRLISKTRRLMAMFFGSLGKHQIDIRVRITNGQAELVFKKGGYHAEDRVELAQNISPDQFLGLCGIFGSLEFNAKIGERSSYNFDLGEGAVFTIAKAGKFYYTEIEKLSNKKNLEANRKKLIGIMNRLKLKPFETPEGFYDLCRRLTEQCDWKFKNTRKDLARLSSLLNKYK